MVSLSPSCTDWAISSRVWSGRRLVHCQWLAPGRLSLVGVLQGSSRRSALLGRTQLRIHCSQRMPRWIPFGSRHPIRVCRWRWRRLMNWNGTVNSEMSVRIPLDVVEVQAALYDSLQSLLVNTTRSVAAMAPADRSSGHFPTGFHPSATGRIRVVASLLSTPAGSVHAKRFARLSIRGSDSTLAYDEGPAFTGLGLGNGGRVGQSFELPVRAEISSITFSLEAPVAGDSLYAELWTFNGAPAT